MSVRRGSTVLAVTNLIGADFLDYSEKEAMHSFQILGATYSGVARVLSRRRKRDEPGNEVGHFPGFETSSISLYTGIIRTFERVHWPMRLNLH